ncbi:MAG TPA: hypothetical protein VIT65_03745 [Microlunatus sp.]
MNRTKKILLKTLSSLAVVGVIGGALAVGSQGQLAASFGPGQTRVGGAPWSESYQYTGAVQYVNVPPDTDSMTVVATGGDGGGDSVWPDDEVEGSGAVVTGTIAVTPGQRVAISVGGVGQEGESGSSDPRGGWGGLGLTGGNGNGASDHLRTSGAGGGATTIQLANNDGSNEQTLIVAAGGGGNGAASGDSGAVGNGGDGGHAWGGQKGEGGSDLWGGSGGQPATNASGAGLRGKGGSGLGGNGGGGGGGVAGGSGGGGAKGTSAGGGGGSGSSIASTQMTSTSIAERYASTAQQTSSNGTVTITWADI